MKKQTTQHPWYHELCDYEKNGKIDRRDFLKYAAVLGVTASVPFQAAGMIFPKSAGAANIKRGGVLKVASSVMKIAHPSNIGWGQPANMMMQMLEHLVVVNNKNVPEPYLLKNWKVSDDLKTWTLNLRQGIKFNNGDVFNANDVIFTFKQWLDKTVASSMASILSPILDLSGIERKNDYQVILHLKKPNIGIPFYLAEFPAFILNHRTFEGDILKAPHGTGPYTLVEYKPGEQVKFKRRKDYWQKGFDDAPLPYLDEMHFIDMGTEAAPKIAAIRSGDIHFIDLIDEGGVQFYQSLNKIKKIKIIPSPSAYTNVMRMQVTQKPWDDNRVRMALKHCQNREKILALSFFGQGMTGHDAHIYPNAASYCPKQIQKYNPEKSKALLKEAGYESGIDVTMTIPGDVNEIVRFGEILKEDAAQGGFRINLETISTSQYWEKWTEVPLGVTAWAHRNFDLQVFDQAYSADENGVPGSWNESKWVDKEFMDLVSQANGTLDVDKRKNILCRIEDIQMSRGSVGISYFANGWYIMRDNVHNVRTDAVRTWIEPNIWMS